MNPLALGLALSAAVLHATWNLFVKTSGDRMVAAFTVSAGGALLNLPVLAVVGLPDRKVWGLILVSSVIQTIYMLLLSQSYQHGDLAFVYPVARGVAPILVTFGGVVFLRDRISLLGMVGVAVVTSALAVIALARKSRSGLGWALATGTAIATYTVIDAAASRTDGSAIPVVGSMFVIHAIMLGLVVGAVRGRSELMSVARKYPWRALFGGAGSAAGYLMVMMAAVMAPVGLVSAVRETSVVLGVLAGRRFLSEHVTRIHLVAVGCAAAGTVLIGLS